MVHDFHDHWDDGNKDDSQNDDLEVLFDPGQSAEKMPGCYAKPHPERRPDNAEGQKLRIRHVAHPGDKRGERPDNRHKPGQDNRLDAILLKEVLGFLEIAPVEDTAFLMLKQLPTEESPDGIVDIVANQSRTKEERIQQRQTEPTGHRPGCIRSRKRARREQQGISRQKRQKDQSRFAENDREEDRVDAGAVMGNRLDKPVVQVAEKIHKAWRHKGGCLPLRTGSCGRTAQFFFVLVAAKVYNGIAWKSQSPANLQMPVG